MKTAVAIMGHRAPLHALHYPIVIHRTTFQIKALYEKCLKKSSDPNAEPKQIQKTIVTSGKQDKFDSVILSHFLNLSI